MDNFEAFLFGALTVALIIGIPVIIVSTDSVVIDGDGVATDLSNEQMQDIANYIEEKYPENFNYRSIHGDSICCGRCRGGRE